MQIKIHRLNHVQICIPKGMEGAAREFYGNVLGLVELEKPDVLKPNGGLWFEMGDVQLHIGIEDAQSSPKRHPAFEVADLAGIKKHLHTNGVRIKDEPSVPGAHRFSFFDPFGNRIELMELV